MSLAVAIWESPSRYALAADSLITSHLGAPVVAHESKTFSRGRWFGAWAGTLVAAQAFTRALGDFEDDDVDAALWRAWEATLAICPPASSDRWRSTDTDVLLVGPPGIVRLSATGGITRHASYGVIGCADEYVHGWMDARGGLLVEDVKRVVQAACLRYPGVGGPIERRVCP